MSDRTPLLQAIAQLSDEEKLDRIIKAAELTSGAPPIFQGLAGNRTASSVLMQRDQARRAIERFRFF